MRLFFSCVVVSGEADVRDSKLEAKKKQVCTGVFQRSADVFITRRKGHADLTQQAELEAKVGEKEMPINFVVVPSLFCVSPLQVSI